MYLNSLQNHEESGDRQSLEIQGHVGCSPYPDYFQTLHHRGTGCAPNPEVPGHVISHQSSHEPGMKKDHGPAVKIDHVPGVTSDRRPGDHDLGVKSGQQSTKSGWLKHHDTGSWAQGCSGTSHH